MAVMTDRDKAAFRKAIADEGAYTAVMAILSSGSKAALQPNTRTAVVNMLPHSTPTAERFCTGLTSGGSTLSDIDRVALRNAIPDATIANIETDWEAVA